MQKYLCLQRSLPSKQAPHEKPSPAQMQAMYAKFNEWREKFQKNLVDLGGRLGKGRVALPDPAPDGPFVEVKELVGGYMIVSAESLDEAIQMADFRDGTRSPILSLSDKTRKGALLGVEYDPSTKQIVGLIDQMQTAKHLEEAGFVVDLQAKAALQHQAKQTGVMDLNMFAEELHGVFLSGLRRAGVPGQRSP